MTYDGVRVLVNRIFQRTDLKGCRGALPRPFPRRPSTRGAYHLMQDGVGHGLSRLLNGGIAVIAPRLLI